MPLLLCPNCNVGMLVVQRSGVELDTCPQCRGIWLDRGELEKLLQPIRDQMHNQEPAGGNSMVAPSPFGRDSHYQNTQHTGQYGQGQHPSNHYPNESSHHGHNKHDHDSSKHYPSDKDRQYRKKSPMESLFEIFD